MITIVLAACMIMFGSFFLGVLVGYHIRPPRSLTQLARTEAQERQELRRLLVKYQGVIK